jgi:heme-degrading monooxygenase HmoA
MAKIMTVLEARAPQEHWAALVEKAKGLPSLPPGLEQSFFVQDTSDPERWRTVGIWSSREAFEAFRQSVGTPPPLVMFRSFGVEPTLAFFDIVV